MNNDQARAMRAVLLRDNTSAPTELVYYFVHEFGVAPRDAWKAVYHRPPLPSINAERNEMSDKNRRKTQRF